MKQLSLNKSFIVSLWLEALVYGFFFCLFCASLYVNFTLRRWQDSHSRAMFIMGIVFFLVATMHLAMNCFRMVRGYVDHVNDPGGAVGYLGNLAPWDHVFKDTLYATQEILGDGVAIYRCWVIWSRRWRIIAFPCMLFIVSLISGYTVCGLYPSQKPDDTVFDPRLTHWISTFYAVAVVQSAITTGLMAYKIWITDRRSASYRANISRGSLLPVLRILVESASLQLFVEAILLGLYSADINAQYILLEIVTPLVGITFTAITIRLSLRMSGALDTTKSYNTSTHNNNTSHAQIATIGSMPMRPITINITQDVHRKQDQQPPFDYHHYHHRKASVPMSMVEELEQDAELQRVEEKGSPTVVGDGESKSFVYASTEKLESPDGEVDGSGLERPEIAELGYHAV